MSAFCTSTDQAEGGVIGIGEGCLCLMPLDVLGLIGTKLWRRDVAMWRMAHKAFACVPLPGLSPDTLEELATLMAAAKEPTVFDMGGKTLAGPLPMACGNLLLMDAPGLTLQDGVLMLPDGARLVVRGQGARLERLSVHGSGIPKGVETRAPACLVWVDGAKGSELIGCSVAGGTCDGCSVLRVDGGATAELSRCDLSGGAKYGLYIQGAGTRVVARDTWSHGNNGMGMVACLGASVELDGCSMLDNKWGGGMHIYGTGTRLVARGCSVMGNNGVMALQIDYQSDVQLHGCNIHGNGKGGMRVGLGSHLAAFHCRLWNNTNDALCAEYGSAVELVCCTLEGGRYEAVHACGPGTRVQLSACMLDKPARVDQGGEVVVEDVVPVAH